GEGQARPSSDPQEMLSIGQPVAGRFRGSRWRVRRREGSDLFLYLSGWRGLLQDLLENLAVVAQVGGVEAPALAATFIEDREGVGEVPLGVEQLPQPPV